jgi:hypothetical protein
MGDYYNTTRTSLSVLLGRGGSVVIGPKTWCYVSPEDEGTTSLTASLRKGHLVRATAPRTTASVPSVVPVGPPVPAVAEVLPLEVVVTATPVPESAPPTVSTLEPELGSEPEPERPIPTVVGYKQSGRNKHRNSI